MKILILHHNYPGQFRNLIKHLAGNENADVLFVSDNDSVKTIGGIRHLSSGFKAPRDKKKQGKSIAYQRFILSSY